MVSDPSIESAHTAAAEQLLSDETILGAVPDDVANVIVNHALARLELATAGTGSVEAFQSAFDQIRTEARTIAEEAAAREDDAASLQARLDAAGGSAEPSDGAVNGLAEPEPATEPADVDVAPDSPEPGNVETALPPDVPEIAPGEPAITTEDDTLLDRINRRLRALLDGDEVGEET